MAIIRITDHMSTSLTDGIWADDPDLVDWIVGVVLKRPKFAGRFITSLCAAARHADQFEYAVMRPILNQI